MENTKNLRNDKDLFWFLLFGGEIILFIFSIMITTSFINKERLNISVNEDIFLDTMNKYNYDITLNDSIDYITKYIIGKKDDIIIQYFKFEDSNIALTSYTNLKLNLPKNIFGNYSYMIDGKISMYRTNSNGVTYIIAKNDNYIIYGCAHDNYVNELEYIFTEFGFSSMTIYGLILLLLLLLSPIIILLMLSYWKLFVKAGYKGWYALIPFYNLYIIYKIAFKKGIYFILLFIPIVNVFSNYVMFYKFARSYGKGKLFSILNIFFSFFTLQIIAFDDSKYIS